MFNNNVILSHIRFYVLKISSKSVVDRKKCLRNSIKNLTKNMHIKNDMNRTISVAVISPTALQNSISRKCVLKQLKDKINSKVLQHT